MNILKFCIAALFVANLYACNKCKDPVFENKIILFEQPDLEGIPAEYNVATKLVEDSCHSTKNDGMENNASSVSFDLAPGIIVYLFEKEDCKGVFVKLEGQGSMNLAGIGMDNMVSSLKLQIE